MGGRAALCALGGGVSATIASNLLLFLMHAMNSTVVNTVCNGGVLVASTLLSAATLHQTSSRAPLCSACRSGLRGAPRCRGCRFTPPACQILGAFPR